MAHWLATERTVQATATLTRFDAAYWTVNFPRPMMAAATNPAPDAIRVDAVFYRTDDLAGLIWEAADRFDHVLLRYDTARDFRRCRLRFRWRSGGIIALDAVNGPTLTIEGRDAAGLARTWYVRLWNYAQGSREDAWIDLDFAALTGGFRLPDDADPVWAGDVDRMFVSLAAPGYTGAPGALPAPAEGWAELSGIACTGSGSVLTLGDVIVPETSLGIATGYDDCYNLTPARVLRNALQLGYRGTINHYVGMSHYFRLEAYPASPDDAAPARTPARPPSQDNDGGSGGGADLHGETAEASGGLYVSLAGGVLNVACAAWHRDFAARAAALGYELIWSLSYELFDAHCWGDWKQRAADGSPALTGWVPPSTLLSPTHGGAMAYLHAVAGALMALADDAGLVRRFQIGEPWWWVMPDGRPCLYDASAVAAFAPVAVASVRGAMTAAGTATLDRAGAALAASTAALSAAADARETLLLAYLPSVLDPEAPEVRRMNLPVGWAAPAFDVLQLEDYDWVTTGATHLTAAGVAEAGARLGYPAAAQHYLSGFVLRPEDAGQWRAIAAAADAARARGTATVFVWALPQVMRDGLVLFDQGEDAVEPFDDVTFPLALGREAEVAPAFSTAITTSAGGFETRNAAWESARTTYDVGPGVRSEGDIATLLAFFRARGGPARGFRLRDPFDWASGAGGTVSPLDQRIGTGDGVTARFALVKHYGAGVRPITRPVAGSVRVAVDGVETAAFALADGGRVELDTPPASGAVVTAGFVFDVPVRFAEDQVRVTRATFLAGAAPSVPLIEVREA